jgi:hypothetical protein
MGTRPEQGVRDVLLGHRPARHLQFGPDLDPGADLLGRLATAQLSKLEKACQGGAFAQRRDAAILSVFRATGIRLAELAQIRYHPGDPGRSDLDLDRREIRVRGKGGKDRTVRIDHEAAPPGPVPAGPRQARAGVPAGVVAGDRRARAADR